MNNPNENENKTVSDFDEIINDIPSSALNTDTPVPPVNNNQNIPTEPKPVMDNNPITKEENINVIEKNKKSKKRRRITVLIITVIALIFAYIEARGNYLEIKEIDFCKKLCEITI